VRFQRRREQSDGLLLALRAGIADVCVAERIGERVTEPVFFTLVEQSAATANISSSSSTTTTTDVSGSATDVGFRRVVYGYRERLLRP
jgi:hypothetical protein